jgi:hypothetical protein
VRVLIFGNALASGNGSDVGSHRGKSLEERNTSTLFNVARRRWLRGGGGVSTRSMRNTISRR